ncbi:helix-turn-helix domain-containing protein [Rhizobium metallidurans]|uniref:Uncharacterized protein n=1 Tax=Rhizobium metallidurans TaxID=1265931 RepID=A0A7W6CT10_9HYPH|nr:helix-turn-helix domain-containing protein [Rhizobium metallidurans]MBB3965926.1 hypothetical protein [Rhizobium metallidurans]
MGVRLPDASVLKAHVAAGMTRGQIADRYGVHPDTVRITFHRYGIAQLAPRRSSPAQRITRHPVRESITIKSDRIVYVREMVAGENGGTTIRCLSLPKISMHVADLRDRGLAEIAA